MHLLGRDTASRGAHRCTDVHSHALGTFTQPRIEHRLRSLVGFNDLPDHSVSLYLGLVDPRGPSLTLSLTPLSRYFPLSYSLFLSLSRSHRVVSLPLPPSSPPLLALHHRRHFISRSVSSCLSSFPSVLLPSFSPTYRFLLLLHSPSLPLLVARSLLFCLYSTVVLPLLVARTAVDDDDDDDGDANATAMQTTSMHASDCIVSDVNGLGRWRKGARVLPVIG